MSPALYHCCMFNFDVIICLVFLHFECHFFYNFCLVIPPNVTLKVCGLSGWVKYQFFGYFSLSFAFAKGFTIDFELNENLFFMHH